MSIQIIITLAHLLRQHSLSYDDEKNSLLDISADLAMRTAHSQPEGEVHMVLTGSPRPTFAETNAWLLEHGGPVTPRKRSNTGDSCMSNATAEGDSMQQGLSLAESSDLHDYMEESHLGSTPNANMNDLCGSPTRMGGSVLSYYRQRKHMEGDAGGGGKGCAKKAAPGNHDGNSNQGPMVGHAINNAIAQTKGVGLHSSRAKLLQGTIDRPLWDQRRWTDGECLFSDLVERCGLESFENVGSHCDKKARSDLADAAAGQFGNKLQKISNLSAHLITVSPQISTSSGPHAGMEDETVYEIARGVIRFLKRKKSPAVSTVHLVLPYLSASTTNDDECERRHLICSQLTQAWSKLEQYNDMIGQPKMLAHANIEVVDV
ncbi:hypothetical protein HJC23_002234 [Cyclotella cryptica]|uniref:Uncharacterized protein n=1 Tax=Cyclotella cryptica TaxID=29204 RepID=A0ABD3QHT5_9STRA|eukprot:CCRYP_005670-RA/>CCRYP_005670-RA protein AED:0.09 eAED:0.09 QI:0/-1/0/1/-1/1/1/0/374